MKVYLDVCALCRPFDDQTIVKLRMETDAVYLILDAVRAGRLELMSSPVHLAEIGDIPDQAERNELLVLLNNCATMIVVNDAARMRRRIESLIGEKFGLADAAHIAYAEEGSDFFVTCDDRVIRKAVRSQIECRVLGPTGFCEEVLLR